nr:MAG TPA: hypothetical protein [Caudoviricetes sp.]
MFFFIAKFYIKNPMKAFTLSWDFKQQYYLLISFLIRSIIYEF